MEPRRQRLTITMSLEIGLIQPRGQQHEGQLFLRIDERAHRNTRAAPAGRRDDRTGGVSAQRSRDERDAASALKRIGHVPPTTHTMRVQSEAIRDSLPEAAPTPLGAMR